MSEILDVNTALDHDLSFGKQVYIPESLKKNYDKPNCEGIVLMAGGNGKRLAPLTNICPKPLLKVGPRPLLETTIKRFISDGYSKFWLSINYLGEMIENYFSDGKHLGAEINYLREKSALGTAGSLSLLNYKPKKPLVVMNADILTDIDFDDLLRKHKASNAFVSICVVEQSIKIPYGVVDHDLGQMSSLKEKPEHKFFINAGIYVIEPAVLDYINGSEFVEMTEVINIIKKGAY